jgi:hypothetical protein
MLQSEYIEDVFLEFLSVADRKGISINYQDQGAANNFHNIITDGNALTEAQGSYLLKILEKHKNVVAAAGFDYRNIIANTPRWKKAFRVIDFSKKVYVEKDSDGSINVCLKFPYQLKKEFEEEIAKNDFSSSVWDSDKKVRVLQLYSTNLIQVFEFATKHNFEIDDTFLIALGEVEEIWQNQDEILPRTTLMTDLVVLENSSPDTFEWWKDHYTGIQELDLLLAKSMGYPYSGKPHTVAEKIAATESNHFWIKDAVTFSALCKLVMPAGKIAFVVDRASNVEQSTRDLVAGLLGNGILIDDIRVCFRLSKEEDTNQFNQWVKDIGANGPIDEGKFFIFNNKPAKWLFKDKESVILLASNNVYPQSGPVTKDWFDSHPCVIYYSEHKPTESRNKKIVEL